MIKNKNIAQQNVLIIIMVGIISDKLKTERTICKRLVSCITRSADKPIKKIHKIRLTAEGGPPICGTTRE